MNLILRLLWVIIHAFYRKPLTFTDASCVTFRVLPNDLDINRHMTNSRYLSIMDLGRVDLMIRCGLMKTMFTHKWKGVIGSANLRFRHSLKLFQSYEVKTRFINVDEKWSYVEHRFESKGQLIAYGLVRAIFIGTEGSIPMATVFKAINLDITPLPLKDFLVLWNDMEAAIKHSHQPVKDDHEHISK